MRNVQGVVVVMGLGALLLGACATDSGATQPTATRPATSEQEGSAVDPNAMTPERQDAIERTFEHKTAELQDCWAQEYQKNHDRKLEDEITLGFEIEPSGAPTNVRILKSTAHNQDIESCVAKEVATWTLPRRQSQGAVPAHDTPRSRVLVKLAVTALAAATALAVGCAHQAPKPAPAPAPVAEAPPPAPKRRADRRHEGRRHARHAHRRRDRRAVPAPLGRHHPLHRRGRRKAAVSRRQDRDQAARDGGGRSQVGVHRRLDLRQLGGRALRARDRARAALRAAAGRRRGRVLLSDRVPRAPAGADLERGARVAGGGAASQGRARLPEEGAGQAAAFVVDDRVRGAGRQGRVGRAVGGRAARRRVRQLPGAARPRAGGSTIRWAASPRRPWESRSSHDRLRAHGRAAAGARHRARVRRARACAQGGGARPLGRVPRRGAGRARQARPARRQHPRVARRRRGGRGRLFAGDDRSRARRRLGRGRDVGDQHGRRGPRAASAPTSSSARSCPG